MFGCARLRTLPRWCSAWCSLPGFGMRSCSEEIVFRRFPANSGGLQIRQTSGCAAGPESCSTAPEGGTVDQPAARCPRGVHAVHGSLGRELAPLLCGSLGTHRWNKEEPLEAAALHDFGHWRNNSEVTDLFCVQFASRVYQNPGYVRRRTPPDEEHRIGPQNHPTMFRAALLRSRELSTLRIVSVSWGIGNLRWRISSSAASKTTGVTHQL